LRFVLLVLILLGSIYFQGFLSCKSPFHVLLRELSFLQ
jgi:hypothetical protein